jgi:hypothetical protein
MSVRLGLANSAWRLTCDTKEMGEFLKNISAPPPFLKILEYEM